MFQTLFTTRMIAQKMCSDPCFEFRLRYATDSSDTPARFRIETVKLSPDLKRLDFRCEWDQAGDKFDLGATLEPFTQTT
jgi:hypothetical protein